MRCCVLFCRLIPFLFLALVFACSPAPLEMEEELSQNFYYDPASSTPFDEFRYEWVATGEVAPWRFYYGLVYWRFKRQELTDFSLPYFLIRDRKGDKYPRSFVLEDASGHRLVFEKLNDSSDLSLPYASPAPVDPNESDMQGRENRSFLRADKAPFRGRIYILKPLSGQEPLDWSALRSLYEKAKNQESFIFEWQEDPSILIEGFSEPDRIRFHFNLKEEGMKDFMSTIKRWGIS